LLFVQNTDNLYETSPEKRYIREYTRAKQCTKDNFGDDEDGHKFFESWEGYSILCPDFSEKKFIMKGSLGAYVTQYMTFEI